jgi:hypothetical protein
MMNPLVCPHCNEILAPEEYYLHIYLCDACIQADEI